MREWYSGSTSPCQGEDRGFDPRLALTEIGQPFGCPISVSTRQIWLKPPRGRERIWAGSPAHILSRGRIRCFSDSSNRSPRRIVSKKSGNVELISIPAFLCCLFFWGQMGTIWGQGVFEPFFIKCAGKEDLFFHRDLWSIWRTCWVLYRRIDRKNVLFLIRTVNNSG